MNKVRLAFVVSEFNSEITFKMLNTAKTHVQSLNADLNYICFVPGAFDMPLFIEGLLRKNDVDAVVTLGSVIKGETSHDQIVATNVSRLIGYLSLKYRKPVTLGITGPDMNLKQARERVVVVSRRAVDAAVKMTERLRKLNINKNGSDKVTIIN